MTRYLPVPAALSSAPKTAMNALITQETDYPTRKSTTTLPDLLSVAVHKSTQPLVVFYYQNKPIRYIVNNRKITIEYNRVYIDMEEIPSKVITTTNTMSEFLPELPLVLVNDLAEANKKMQYRHFKEVTRALNQVDDNHLVFEISYKYGNRDTTTIKWTFYMDIKKYAMERITYNETLVDCGG